MRNKTLYLVLLLITLLKLPTVAQQINLKQINSTEKPWLWWYWLGSAVDKEGIDWHLQQFKDMGFGGASVAATYGVNGYEDKYVPFMSPKWIDYINYTADKFREANMALDVSLTSAWPFGGPNVTPNMAAQYSKVMRLFTAVPGEKVDVSISKFSKGKLCALCAYSDDGEYVELSDEVNSDGTLSYVFPMKKWDVYGLFSFPTGQKTKRSGIGGEGLVIDHFSKSSISRYLQRYDSLFASPSSLRATFNDSYEVYGADYTPSFLDEFQQRRGYDLRKYLYLLVQGGGSDASRRVLCDYRETISDLLLDNFLSVWHEWAEQHHVLTVEQAHGSPANWLDLYGASDIPQTESFGASPLHIKNVRIDPQYNEKSFGRPDKMLLKFASSAAHVTGKRLTSSETATWLGDHFKVALSQVKPQVDELFTCGINHIMLTCGAYSPQNIPFPGWRFYPAADFGHTTSFKETLPAFSHYVSSCQRLLQNSITDNEVLLYVPFYDFLSECDDEDGRSKLMMFTIHNPDNWFYRQDIGEVSRTLKREGFDFDYISDKQIDSCRAEDGNIVTSGGKKYKTIVIPCCKRIPLHTIQNILELTESGVNVIFAYRYPVDVPGYYDLDKRRSDFTLTIDKLKKCPNVKVGANYIQLLQNIGLHKEEFGKYQLEYIRCTNDCGTLYFVANLSNEFREGWIQLGTTISTDVVLYHPLTGESGLAQINGNKVFLQLEPGQSCFVKLYNDGISESWRYSKQIASYRIDGDWLVSFKDGAPSLPPAFHQASVSSWTEAPDSMATYFSGTGIYETTFDLPKMEADHYILSLGDVREVAKVWINDTYVGTSWSVPFELSVNPEILRKKNNRLRVEVRNLDANRVIWLDRNKVQWKNYFIVDVAYRSFDASYWDCVPSGLLGPVELKCCK